MKPGDRGSGMSADLLDQIVGTLTVEPLTVAEVHERVDCWARGTIWNALQALVREGRAMRVGNQPPRYRLPA